MAKTLIMTGKRIVRGELAYTFRAYSSTLAEVVSETLTGTVVERREYVGSRAQIAALIAFQRATGLVKGGAA